MSPFLPLALLAASAAADVHEYPAGKAIPHEAYVRVVSEADSPLEPTYVKTRDGLYVAAALRKPKGPGPFPAVVIFHGAPGGRGMEQLSGWSRGATGGPVWERFLREGFVVVVADYRALVAQGLEVPTPADRVTYVDDGVAVVRHVRELPFVKPDEVSVYGVSLGGNLALHLAGRTKVRALVLGAPAPLGFLGATFPTRGTKIIAIDEALTARNIGPIICPVLIQVGTADSLVGIDRTLHDRLAAAGKSVRLDVYEGGYHDFVMGPQGHPGRAEPLLEGTLDALDRAVAFVKSAGR